MNEQVYLKLLLIFIYLFDLKPTCLQLVCSPYMFWAGRPGALATPEVWDVNVIINTLREELPTCQGKCGA